MPTQKTPAAVACERIIQTVLAEENRNEEGRISLDNKQALQILQNARMGLIVPDMGIEAPVIEAIVLPPPHNSVLPSSKQWELRLTRGGKIVMSMKPIDNLVVLFLAQAFHLGVERIEAKGTLVDVEA